MTNSTKARLTRKKQFIILGGALGGIVTFSMAAAYIADRQAKPTPAAKPTPEVSVPINLAPAKPDKDYADAQTRAEMAQLRDTVKQLRERLDQPPATPPAESKPASISTRAPVAPPEPPPGVQFNNPKPQAGSLFTQAGVGTGAMPPPPTLQQGGKPVPPTTPGLTFPGNPAAQGAPKASSGPAIRSYDLDASGSEPSPQGAAPRIAAKAEPPADPGRKKTYLPAGTFARGVLLNGIDAPTGGLIQNNPHPVLVKLVDNAVLPNGFRADVKDCIVTGAGYGDRSSERALIKLDRLSCVDEEGGAVDISVKGYISGEDGKTGLRGHLVSKSGKVLSNAFVTGTLASLGEVLRQGATTVNTTAVGTQTSTINNPGVYALSSGVGSAFSRLANYYISLAETQFSVVEVDGGRTVEVVLQQGVTIQRH
jgi:conjugal transfer pilus assembly protein TraB